MSLRDEIGCIIFESDTRPLARHEGPPLDDVPLRVMPAHLITKDGRATSFMRKTDGSEKVRQAILKALEGRGWVVRDTLVLKVRCARTTLSASLSQLVEAGAIERRRMDCRSQYRRRA